MCNMTAEPVVRWLSIPQVAKAIGVNRATVWRWVDAKRLTVAGYVNGRPLFDADYIAQVAEQRRQQKAEKDA